jgi:hypothetical protein|tara:strand:+ start:987 stop:1253 length:267 start_codon:yes stop_codon:yes gene_type:complete
MSTARIYTSFAKAAAYTAWALNQMLYFGKNAARTVSDSINDTKRYKVELLVDGATLKTKNDQSARQLCKLLENMDDFGINGIIVHEMD